MLRGCFNCDSVVFQTYLRLMGVSYFKGDSYVFHGCLSVSRLIVGFFNGVSRVFHWDPSVFCLKCNQAKEIFVEVLLQSLSCTELVSYNPLPVCESADQEISSSISVNQGNILI